MTLIQTGPPHTRGIFGSSRGPAEEFRSGRAVLVRARRLGVSRPAGAPFCYRGTGVEMSTAARRKHPIPVATTLGLALLAAVITLWLGLMAHFGSVINGIAADKSLAGVPDRLAVVRVEPGESLDDLAVRLAPDAPVRRVVDRIRELNALDSPMLASGQTLIVPVG